VRGLDDVRAIFKLGVEKIVLNTIAVESPAVVRQISSLTGSSSVVVSIDVKRKLFGGYEVFTRGGRRSTGLNPIEFAQQMEAEGAGEILLNSIDRDGMMQVYDLALLARVTAAVNVPVICCGGAGSMEHFRAA